MQKNFIGRGLICKIFIHFKNCFTEGPGVARGQKKLKKKNIQFFSLYHIQATHECLQNISAHSVQPFCRPEARYILLSCFIILYMFRILYISKNIKYLSKKVLYIKNWFIFFIERICCIYWEWHNWFYAYNKQERTWTVGFTFYRMSWSAYKTLVL